MQICFTEHFNRGTKCLGGAGRTLIVSTAYYLLFFSGRVYMSLYKGHLEEYLGITVFPVTRGSWFLWRLTGQAILYNAFQEGFWTSHYLQVKSWTIFIQRSQYVQWISTALLVQPLCLLLVTLYNNLSTQTFLSINRSSELPHLCLSHFSSCLRLWPNSWDRKLGWYLLKDLAFQTLWMTTL